MGFGFSSLSVKCVLLVWERHIPATRPFGDAVSSSDA